MKKLIVVIMLFCASKGYTQIVIPANTPISTVAGYATGSAYRIFYPGPKDTVDLTIGKQIVCPVCPVCPPAAKQRTCIGYSYDALTGKTTFVYDDGTKSLKRKEPLK